MFLLFSPLEHIKWDHYFLHKCFEGLSEKSLGAVVFLCGKIFKMDSGFFIHMRIQMFSFFLESVLVSSVFQEMCIF